MSQILKSSSAMAVATTLSRFLGLVREQVYAYFMGTSPVAGAFKLAFQIPNLFRRLLGEGALTAAFIPIFREKEKTEGEKEMWHAANAVMSGLVIATALIVGLVLIGISVVLAVTAPHYTATGAAIPPPWPLPVLKSDTRLMLQLLRIVFPYLLLVCLAAMSMGMLNARGYFFIPALGASMLNVVLVAAVFLLAPRFGKRLDQQIFGLAIGVLIAGVAQFTFQLPLLFKQGFRFRWVSPWGNDTVRETVRRMIPGTIGVAAFQLNVLIIQAVAFTIDSTMVAAFDTGVRLMEFPQGIVGISLATYLLTALSGLAAEKKYPEFRSTLTEGLGLLVFANLLAAVILLVLARPIVRLLFEHGRFNALSAMKTSMAVTCLAPGLVAYSAVNVIARAFFALGDTKTPMRISIACLVLNLVVALWLVGPFREAGLAAANTLTAFVNVTLLARALRKKMPRMSYATLRPTLVSLFGAAVLAGLVAWGALHFWDRHWGHASLAAEAGEVFVPMGLATLTYFGVAWAMGVKETRAFLSVLLRRVRSSGNPSGPNS